MGQCNNCGNASDPKEAKFCSSCGAKLSGLSSALGAKVVDTSFENKCAILSQLWLNYRDEEQFTEFFEYNDLGLPLAYILDNKIADLNDTSQKFIDETFELLLELLELQDQGFESLDEMLKAAE